MLRYNTGRCLVSFEVVGIAFIIGIWFWWRSTDREKRMEDLKYNIKIVLSPDESMNVPDIKSELSQRGITVTDGTLETVIRELVDCDEIKRVIDPSCGLNQPIRKWRLKRQPYRR